MFRKKKFNLGGNVIKVLKEYPITEIEAKTREEAEEIYLNRFCMKDSIAKKKGNEVHIKEYNIKKLLAEEVKKERKRKKKEKKKK